MENAKMKLFQIFIIALCLIPAFPAFAEPIGGTPIPPRATVGRGIDISVDYLLQARKFRDEGRYELARQSYAQAISTCRNEANLEIIKRELAGVELLIRTMR